MHVRKPQVTVQEAMSDYYRGCLPSLSEEEEAWLQGRNSTLLVLQSHPITVERGDPGFTGNPRNYHKASTAAFKAYLEAHPSQWMGW